MVAFWFYVPSNMISIIFQLRTGWIFKNLLFWLIVFILKRFSGKVSFLDWSQLVTDWLLTISVWPCDLLPLCPSILGSWDVGVFLLMWVIGFWKYDIYYLEESKPLQYFGNVRYNLTNLVAFDEVMEVLN